MVIDWGGCIKMFFMIKFKAKLRVIWGIITGKYKHCFIVYLDTDNLKELVRGNDYAVNSEYFGLRKYIVSKIIKDISDTKDEIDLALDKAQFEADCLINKK
jgi:CRISPR/Cas system-associated protein Cas5 (RAMP superfamily)